MLHPVFVTLEIRDASVLVGLTGLLHRLASITAHSMSMTSYPYPDDLNVVSQDELVPIHPLRQILRPNATIAPPSVILPPEVEISGFTRTSHLIPAASPRNLPAVSPLRQSTLQSTPQSLESAIESLGNARKAFEERKRHQVEDTCSQQQWICVDRYVPRNSRSCSIGRNGVTLFMVHSGGFYRQVISLALH